MSVTLVLVVLFSAWAGTYDVLERRIPNYVVGVALLACMVAYVMQPYPWSWWGVGAALLITSAARLPWGDRKAVMVLGGLLGPLLISAVAVAALGGGLLAFALYRLGRLPYPGAWPLFPFFAVPACVIVLALTT
jgi:Flp pilus assembly protein protease CpaA